MRRENHRTGVTRPMLDVQSGIVLWNIRITRVAEDGLDKIEIADQRAWSKKPDFHRLGGSDSYDFGTNDWSQQQRYEATRLMLLLRCERKQEQFVRRLKGTS